MLYNLQMQEIERSRKEIPPQLLSTPESPKPESPKPKQGRIKEKEYKQLKEDFFLDLTLSALSHIETHNIEKLARNPRMSLQGLLPGRVSLDAVLGIDPKKNKQTKNREVKEACFDGLSQTIDRLWNQQSIQVSTPKERKILTKCQELEQMGIDKEKVKEVLAKHYGVEIPLTSSPAQIFPKDKDHSR